MRVVVVTRSTPDTAAKVEARADGTVGWPDEALILNPWDEYAVTEAVLLKETHGVQTTILAVGPEAHAQALRQGIATGLDSAVRLWQPEFEGQGSARLARLVAAAVAKLGDVRLVLFGREFVDSVSEAHIPMTARYLGWPVITAVSKIEAIDFAKGSLVVRRQREHGADTVRLGLPAVLSVLKDINAPRYPSFINIRKASKAEIPVWGAADMGLPLDQVAGSGAAVTVRGYQNLPARTGTVQFIEGATDAEKAAALLTRLREDKIL